MPYAPRIHCDAALKERIRVAYYDEKRPVPEVVAVSEVSRSTMYKWFEAWGWPRRRQALNPERRRRNGPVFLPGGMEVPASAGWKPARASLKRRLAHLVAHRIAVLEHEAMTGVAVDPGANARAIELNARTLVTIEKLEEATGTCSCRDADDRPMRSPAELRDELYARLLQLRREKREAAGLPPEDSVSVTSGAQESSVPA